MNTSSTVKIRSRRPSSSRSAGREVLAGFTGVVVADGYGAYDALVRAGPGRRITLAHCWALVRRKFIEAEAHYPEPRRSMLDLIGQLYAVEREVPSLAAMSGENEVMRANSWRGAVGCATSALARSSARFRRGRWPSGRCQRAAWGRPSVICSGCGRG